MTRRVRLVLFAFAGLGLAAVLLVGFHRLPHFGHAHELYGAVINRTEPTLRHATDIVTALNFDIRGFDTLGELREALVEPGRDVVAGQAVHHVVGAFVADHEVHRGLPGAARERDADLAVVLRGERFELGDSRRVPRLGLRVRCVRLLFDDRRRERRLIAPSPG